MCRTLGLFLTHKQCFVETEQRSSVEPEQMSAVETGQMSTLATGQMSAVETGTGGERGMTGWGQGLRGGVLGSLELPRGGEERRGRDQRRHHERREDRKPYPTPGDP